MNHHRRPTSAFLVPLVLAAAGLAAATAVPAQTLKDPVLEALYVAEKSDELQRVAALRLAAQPDDAQAVLAAALAALRRNDTAARTAAIGFARACIERQPRAAPCQYALGVVLGVQAISEGLFKAARSIGKVRDALQAAYDIDPAWYPARSALLQFHLEVPGMMGGSAAQAGELARGAPRPEQARALQARVALGDGKFEAALQALAALPAPLEPALAEDVCAWAAQAGLGLVNASQAAKAQPALEKLQREQAGCAGPAYALARVRGEAGAHAEALRLYETAVGLRGAAAWPLHYRIGMEQQALGRREEARSAYQRFVAEGRGPDKLLDDARKRLQQLLP